LPTGGTNPVISLAVASVANVWRRIVGKLADGNAEEAKRERLIEQLTNFTSNSVPRGTREPFRISVSIQAALSPKLIIDGTEAWFEHLGASYGDRGARKQWS
jgi:hypothetical protein